MGQTERNQTETSVLEARNMDPNQSLNTENQSVDTSTQVSYSKSLFEEHFLQSFS